jgi:pyrophosphatase PpaX
MKDALAALRQGGLKMAVVTSKLHETAWRGLTAFGLERYVEFLIGADDCPAHKPEPGGLLLAAQRLHVPVKHCAYVGDSPYDIQAALSAKMLAVGAAWGMFGEQRLKSAGAQIILSEPEQLPIALGVVSLVDVKQSSSE